MPINEFWAILPLGFQRTIWLGTSVMALSSTLVWELKVWFGVITLMRGACLSLPSVFAPNRPNVQLVMMHSVMLISLASWVQESGSMSGRGTSYLHIFACICKTGMGQDSSLNISIVPDSHLEHHLENVFFFLTLKAMFKNIRKSPHLEHPKALQHIHFYNDLLT